jgi:uncharacterized membrane protein HdeD (DUF308 family)
MQTSLKRPGVSEYLIASAPGWFGVLGGIWLIAAPFVLSYNSQDKLFYNDLAMGIILIILSGLCALTVEIAQTAMARQLAGWLVALGGLWLIAAPFVLDYTTTTNALWNDIVCGVVFAVVAVYSVVYHARTFTKESY